MELQNNQFFREYADHLATHAITGHQDFSNCQAGFGPFCCKSLTCLAGSLIFLCFLLLSAPAYCGTEHTSQGVDSAGKPQWLSLEPGLDYGEFRLDETDSPVSVLRIDPAQFDFTLCSAGQTDGNAATLEQWAARNDLVAAINASMYLPDGLTSTGHMRSGDYVNNPRMVERFGAFFVADPYDESLPRATIIDKDAEDWKETLAHYKIAIQNYRMTNAERRILWQPGGPLYSISAVAQDGEGRILFLHSRRPVEAYKFVQQLLHLPLDVRTIMYVEGGAQAGLLVNAGKFKRDFSGTHAPSFLVTGNLKASLPNVLGVRRHEQQPAAATEKTLGNAD